MAKESFLEKHRKAVREFIQSQGLQVLAVATMGGFYATECPNCHTGAFYYRWTVNFIDPELGSTPITGEAISMKDLDLGTGIIGPLKGNPDESVRLFAATICKVCNQSPKLPE
jgi:hypothetical protein